MFKMTCEVQAREVSPSFYELRMTDFIYFVRQLKHRVQNYRRPPSLFTSRASGLKNSGLVQNFKEEIGANWVIHLLLLVFGLATVGDWLTRRARNKVHVNKWK